jgi:hypothetical protein
MNDPRSVEPITDVGTASTIVEAVEKLAPGYEAPTELFPPPTTYRARVGEQPESGD